MTEIDLKDRLTASVADIDAPAELLDRARAGGSRRLRRRRLTSVATGALAVALVGGIAVTGQAILADAQPEVAAGPAAGDPYGFLLKWPTRGNLAGDQAYFDQVVAAWQGSHDKSENKSRGIFDDLRGTPQVVWAGRTPAGPAAIVVQQAYLHHHEDIQLDREGLYTLIGLVGPGADGKPKVVADSYPAPGVGLATGFVVGDGQKALIVLDTGHQVGWSKERLYTADGHSGRQYTPLKFTDGVSVVSLPEGVNVDGLRIRALPVTGPSGLNIHGIPGQGAESVGDNRLWSDAGSMLWAMTPGAEGLAKTAEDTLRNTLDAARDPAAYSIGFSLWTGYGRTANGSELFLGELVLDRDLTRVYAVLKKNGRTTIVPGGVPLQESPLPVSIKLPDGQGWAVAQKDADLSYRVDGGNWSTPRKNALLVPAGRDAEAKVATSNGETTVQLH
jgi:hypothetical protein